MDIDLTVQPIVWTFGAESFAVLYCEDPAEITARDEDGENVSGLVSTVIANGLPWIQNAVQLNLDAAQKWHAELDDQARLTVDWPAPHGRPLLINVALNWPPAWVDAMRKQEALLLFCGANLGLTNGVDPTDQLVEHAATGALAGGIVPFRETPGTA